MGSCHLCMMDILLAQPVLISRIDCQQIVTKCILYQYPHSSCNQCN